MKAVTGLALIAVGLAVATGCQDLGIDRVKYRCTADDQCGQEWACCPDGACARQGTCEADLCGPSCGEKACGPDGCGGTCGTCGCGEECQGGTCEFTACWDKACGPDGCGGSCGTCSCGEECQSGACAFEACSGKACGPDGCGGSCGACAPESVCQEGKCFAPMVPVPAGSFMMGCNEVVNYCVCTGNPNASLCPYHEVYVPGFEIDKYEVTNADFAAFLNAVGSNNCGDDVCVLTDLLASEDALGQAPTGNWEVEAGYEEHPVVWVTWYGADAYCKTKCSSCRLCSEAEWEKAARGAAGALYPWGNASPSCDLAVMRLNVANGWGCGTGWAAPVGSKPAGESPYGAMDMSGNVWEWVKDWYHDRYDCCGGAPLDGGAWETPAGTERVRRGGSYQESDALALAASFRIGLEPRAGMWDLGFRCCR